MLGITTRNEILSRALIVESLTSSFIGGLLGIKNIQQSRTLGHQGSSISLINRIDLLIDLGALDADMKANFQVFVEVRNQFMHNLEASTFEKCVSYTGKKNEWFFKKYPPPAELTTTESQLKYSVLKIADEVVSATGKIVDHLKQKFREQAYNDSHKKSNTAFIESINEAKVILDDLFERRFEANNPITLEELKGFGTQTSKIIFALWKKKFQASEKEQIALRESNEERVVVTESGEERVAAEFINKQIAVRPEKKEFIAKAPKKE